MAPPDATHTTLQFADRPTQAVELLLAVTANDTYMRKIAIYTPRLSFNRRHIPPANR